MKRNHQTAKILQTREILTILTFFFQARVGINLSSQPLKLKFIHQANQSNPQSHKGSMYSIQSCQMNDHT